MPVRQYANAPATALTNSCTALATSITVDSTTGLPITFPYTLIIDRGLATEEAVSVTAAAGSTLTVTRGIDSTTAFAHTQGAVVAHGITAQDIREANAHVNASSGVHGRTGDVVGTTDTQTLTNKTLSADSNTINGFAASSFVISDGTGKADGGAAQKAIPAGAVVGTTDTQTLTNKTLALGSNTVSGTKAQFNTAVTDGNPVWDNEIGLWTGYTPTIGGFTGTLSVARYVQIGKLVTVYGKYTVTTVSGTMSVSLPVAASASLPLGTGSPPIGRATALNVPTIVAFGADVYAQTTTTVQFLPPSGAPWNATVPFTWSGGDDTLTFAFSYEAA